jgi:hypothetical protein
MIYLLFNVGGDTRGWAVPIATDIALVGGVMSLLGRRLTGPLQVFMLALAIVDDIVAILVIALFYSGSITLLPVSALVVLAGLLLLVNRLGVRHVWVYGILGFLFWLALLQAGIEPTLAGVALAVAYRRGAAWPPRTSYGPRAVCWEGSSRFPRRIPAFFARRRWGTSLASSASRPDMCERPSAYLRTPYETAWSSS